MEKAYILAEICRTATENGGAPLGRQAFQRETGIKESDWYGRFWARWGDALLEAGFQPNQKQGAYTDEYIIQKLVTLIRELKRFPTSGEIRLKAQNCSEFPSHNTFGRLGSKRTAAEKIIAFCRSRTGNEDVVAICESITALNSRPSQEDFEPKPEDFGSVYLLRSGQYYKIGRTNSAGRRERELSIQLPDKAHLAHIIRTDDPTGIESYWHRRFAEKRKNGEWFALTASDVSAFKRRKFM